MAIDRGPLLGLATTRELLEELKTRALVRMGKGDAQETLLGDLIYALGYLPIDDLNYRTVDHD
jgi:hypothetical protein